MLFDQALSATELRAAVNRAYDYLCNPNLSDRNEFKDAYRGVVQDWLDSAHDDPPSG